MPHLANPYKLDETLPNLVHLQADVSDADWQKVFLTAPYRGLQDKILSSLFQKFAEQVAKEIEPTPKQSNEQRLANIIQRCSFSPIGSDGH